MLKTIIEKEMRDLIGSAKFAITFGACAFLIIAAFYAGAARYQLERERYETSVTETLRGLEGHTDWFSVGEMQAYLPPQPLATLVSGVSNDIGRTAEVRGRGEPIIQDSRYNEDPIYAVFRFLDLEFLFTIILSLFAVLLGYDAISGEKERGTLRLSFANAVPRATYVIGKLVGSAIVLTVSLGVAIALGALLLPLMGVPMGGADWGRLSLIVLTGLLYFGTFLTLSVAVSAVTQRSSSSFLVLLVTWIAAVLIIPRVAVLTAGRAVDVPSVDSIAAQKGTYGMQLNEEFRDGMAGLSIDMEEVGDNVMGAINSYMDSLGNIRDSKMQELSGRLNEDRHNRQQTQSAMAFNLARLSPMTSLTLAVSHLARTSLDLKERFYRESTAYSALFGEFKREKIGVNSGHSMRVIRIGDEDAEEPERIDPTEIPAFVFTEVPFGESVSKAAPDIGLLTIFNLLFFAGAVTAFRRYDVR